MTNTKHWPTKQEEIELVNLYHLARALVGDERHARLIQASKWFAKDCPDIPEIRAYKALTRVLA